MFTFVKFKANKTAKTALPGLRAGTCCAVLRGSLLIVCKQARLTFV